MLVSAGLEEVSKHATELISTKLQSSEIMPFKSGKKTQQKQQQQKQQLKTKKKLKKLFNWSGNSWSFTPSILTVDLFTSTDALIEAMLLIPSKHYADYHP